MELWIFFSPSWSTTPASLCLDHWNNVYSEPPSYQSFFSQQLDKSFTVESVSCLLPAENLERLLIGLGVKSRLLTTACRVLHDLVLSGLSEVSYSTPPCSLEVSWPFSVLRAEFFLLLETILRLFTWLSFFSSLGSELRWNFPWEAIPIYTF